MSIGSVLIQPQRLARSESAASDASALGDVAQRAIGVHRDALGGGQIVAQFEAAGEAAAERVLAHAQGGLAHAQQRLAAMVATPVQRLQALAHELVAIHDADGALTAAHDLLAALTDGAEELTIDHIRAHVGELLDIVEHDLGLTRTFVEDQVWAFFDDFVERLEHVAPEPDPSLRTNRLQVIGALRRLRRRVGNAFEFPELDVEHASEDLFAFIRRTGIPDGAARVACLGTNLAQAAQSGRDLLQAVPFTGFLPGSLGSAVVPEPAHDDDTYLWYPSWLANQNRHPAVHLALIAPGDEVRINHARTQIVQRNTWRDDKLIASGTNLAWKDHPRLGDNAKVYTFGAEDADAMETFAHVTAVLQGVLEVVFNLFSLEEGDIWANIVNVFGGVTYALWEGAEGKPTPWWLEGLIFRTGLLLLASLEGKHSKASSSNNFMMWLTLAGPDVAEMLTWKYVIGATRNLLLSIVTLANHEKPTGSQPAPRNREEFDGVRHAVTLGLHNLFLLAFKRKNWGVMEGGKMSPLVELIFLWSLLIGTGVGILGGLVGSLLGQAIARDADGESLKTKMWWSIPQCVALTIYWLYLHQEGSTQGGKFTPFAGNDYTGYPLKATSPYKLPFDPAEVSTCYVGQANQGFWSHNFHNVGQVYAYDFSLDHGDEILAARAGTVIQFSESVPDTENPPWQTKSTTLATAIGNGASPATIDVASVADLAAQGWVVIGSKDIAFYTSIAGTTLQGVTWKGGATTAAYGVGDDVDQTIFGWNFIVIKHDVDEAGAALAAPHAHDLGKGGTPTTTVAVYGHGLPGSISAAFRRHNPPVPTASIIGTKVKQGMPIMDAGDTGISFHNHLHMHVIPDPGPDAVTGDYRDFGGNGETIPFVFSDEDAPGDGVLKHFDWYKSSNTRRQS